MEECEICMDETKLEFSSCTQCKQKWCDKCNSAIAQKAYDRSVKCPFCRFLILNPSYQNLPSGPNDRGSVYQFPGFDDQVPPMPINRLTVFEMVDPELRPAGPQGSGSRSVFRRARQLMPLMSQFESHLIIN